MRPHGMNDRTIKSRRRIPANRHDGPSAQRIVFHPWEGYLRNGYRIYVRPTSGRDAALEKAFIARLTPEAFAQCSLGVVQPCNDNLVNDLACMNATAEVRLLALVDIDGAQAAVGLARYRTDEQHMSCDCAVAVDPGWRKLGIGSILMHHLIGIARLHGVRHMYANDAVRDGGAHALAGRLGFRRCPDPADPASVTFELELPP